MFSRQVLPPDAVRLARRRAGAVARPELLDRGVTDQVIKRLVRDGHLLAVTRGVYALGAVSWSTRAWAGLLVAGESSCLSGLAAAHVWNLTAEPPEEIEVRTVRHPHRRAGFRFVRGAPLASEGVPPRTTLEWTAISLASRASTMDGAVHWVTRALAEGGRIEQLLATAEGVANLRRRREVLDLLHELEPGVESALEYRYLQGVERGHGLPQPERQVGTEGERLDLLYRDFGVVIELDGRLGHVDDGAFRDLRRDNRHAEQGLITLRFGWTDVTRNPCAVAAQIASTLRAREWTVRPTRCARCARALAS